MNGCSIVLVALALGHAAFAENVGEMFVQPSLAQEFADIIDSVTGDFKASPHIVGGSEAVPHSNPHQVALYCTRIDNQVGLCGGSLITPEWVLTAAHCTWPMKGIAAFIGAHNITASEQERQEIAVESFVKHDNWNPKTNEHDIAVLKLAKPATLNQYVQPIRLPSLALRNKVLWRTPIELTGWGKYSNAPKELFSPVLRTVTSKVVTNVYCNIRFLKNIMNTMLCADGNQGQGICSGDSGGPMIMTEADGKKTIIGVSSFGSDKGCDKKFPTVFTRVDSYLEWISKHTGVTIRQK